MVPWVKIASAALHMDSKDDLTKSNKVAERAWINMMTEKAITKAIALMKMCTPTS